MKTEPKLSVYKRLLVKFFVYVVTHIHTPHVHTHTCMFKLTYVNICTCAHIQMHTYIYALINICSDHHYLAIRNVLIYLFILHNLIYNILLFSVFLFNAYVFTWSLNLVASNDRNLFSHISEGQKSKISFTEPKSRFQYGCAPSTDSSGKFVSLLFQLLMSAGIPLLVAISYQPLPLSSHHLNAFCMSNLLLPLIRIFVMAFRAHLDNSGLSHLQILN